jgi:DNA-binding response OmpR family regulator
MDRPLILVVEDNEDIRVLLASFLEDCGFRVASASGHRDAADITRTMRPSSVIADVNLRGGNGDDLAQLALALDIPILLISGEPHSIENHQGVSGAFMQKPFRLADLRTKIDEMIVPRP